MVITYTVSRSCATWYNHLYIKLRPCTSLAKLYIFYSTTMYLIPLVSNHDVHGSSILDMFGTRSAGHHRHLS